jgi:hypothetical protein
MARWNPSLPGLGGRALGPLLASIVLASMLGCGSDGPREAIQIPATSSLRGASELLLPRVETVKGAPDWVHRPRLDQGFVYGVGIHPGRRSPEQSLYMAMSAARSAVVAWLQARGARAESQHGLNPPLVIDDDVIDFERLAHDPQADRWYALARLDLAANEAAVVAQVAQLENALRRAQQKLLDASLEDDDRIRSALAIVFGLDRRNQWAAAYHAFSAQALRVPQGLDDATLQEQADDLLSAHGVRILVDGPDVPGLYGSVSSAMGRVHIRSDEFGPGLVTVRIVESSGFGPGNPYLEIDGQVEMAIEGGDARSYTTPFHVVSSGIDIDEARFRAARTINLEVERIVSDTLRTLAESGT